MFAYLGANQPVSRLQIHTATPSCWRRVDGVKITKFD